MGIYTIGNGWAAERTKDGDVVIWLDEDHTPSGMNIRIEFSRTEWVSLVTHMANFRGAITHALAETLHDDGRP